MDCLRFPSIREFTDTDSVEVDNRSGGIMASGLEHTEQGNTY